MERSEARPYHHGAIRTAALERLAETVAAGGAAAVTLRGLAASIGVSHTALGNVFGSRRGMLTAFAVEGYTELAARLETASTAGLVEIGLAYVRFGLERPAHFAVMFDAEFLDLEDPDLSAARDRASSRLRAGIEALDPQATQDRAAAILAAWSLMHGLVQLEHSGLLEASGLAEPLGGDVLIAAERIAHQLFQGSR